MDAESVRKAPTKNALALKHTSQAGKTHNPIVMGRLAVTISPSHSATTDITRAKPLMRRSDNISSVASAGLTSMIVPAAEPMRAK